MQIHRVTDSPVPASSNDVGLLPLPFRFPAVVGIAPMLFVEFADFPTRIDPAGRCRGNWPGPPRSMVRGSLVRNTFLLQEAPKERDNTSSIAMGNRIVQPFLPDASGIRVSSQQPSMPVRIVVS